MSPLRNTARPFLAALVASVVVLSLAACGRDETDLSNGKAQFVQKCGSCHTLSRAGTQGQTGPSLDAAFRAALQAGENRETVEGVVHSQIANVRREQRDARGPGHGRRRQATWPPTWPTPPARPARTAARSRRPAWPGATTGEQIFVAAGCAGCHKLASAGATGNIGPSLDQLAAAAGKREPGKSAEDYVHEAIVDPDAYTVSGFGKGVMPSYEGKLTDKQLDTLVQFLLGE